MKNIVNLSVSILLLIFFFFFFSGGQKKQTDKAKPKVSIVFPVTIDAFQQLKQGVKDATGDKFEIQTYSAEGDPSKFETAIQSALLNNPNYLVTIGTQMTNTAFGAKFKNKLPIVIAGAISSPELVDALITVGIEPKRKSEVAIISDSPKESIYELFSKTLNSFLPNTKKVGIIYNPAEVNSKGTADKIIAELNKNGVQVIDGVINNSEDIEKVTEMLLLKGCEAIIIPHDKNAVTKAFSIVKKCDEKNIPVFSLDDGTVKKDGVSIGISVNYRIIGNLIGQSLLKIDSKEANASDLPIVSVTNAKIYVNTKKIDALGIKQPEALNSLIENVK